MMIRNGKVFISHAAPDEALLGPLVARLRQKDINVWCTIMPEDSDAQLGPKTRREIAARDVFLRICTPAATRSERMRMEAWAFQNSRDEDTPHRHPQPAHYDRPGDGSCLHAQSRP